MDIERQELTNKFNELLSAKRSSMHKLMDVVLDMYAIDIETACIMWNYLLDKDMDRGIVGKIVAQYGYKHTIDFLKEHKDICYKAYANVPLRLNGKLAPTSICMEVVSYCVYMKDYSFAQQLLEHIKENERNKEYFIERCRRAVHKLYYMYTEDNYRVINQETEDFLLSWTNFDEYDYAIMYAAILKYLDKDNNEKCEIALKCYNVLKYAQNKKYIDIHLTYEEIFDIIKHCNEGEFKEKLYNTIVNSDYDLSKKLSEYAGNNLQIRDVIIFANSSRKVFEIIFSHISHAISAIVELLMNNEMDQANLILEFLYFLEPIDKKHQNGGIRYTDEFSYALQRIGEEIANKKQSFSNSSFDIAPHNTNYQEIFLLLSLWNKKINKSANLSRIQVAINEIGDNNDENVNMFDELINADKGFHNIIAIQKAICSYFEIYHKIAYEMWLLALKKYDSEIKKWPGNVGSQITDGLIFKLKYKHKDAFIDTFLNNNELVRVLYTETAWCHDSCELIAEYIKIDKFNEAEMLLRYLFNNQYNRQRLEHYSGNYEDYCIKEVLHQLFTANNDQKRFCLKVIELVADKELKSDLFQMFN